MSKTHIIGAGIAGLAAAVHLARSGKQVTLYEATGQAGGRCRSFHDKTLNTVIDNGNHLLLGANTHALRYIDDIGAREQFSAPAHPLFPFADLATGERWQLQPDSPFWIFDKDKRVPGTHTLDYLRIVKLALADTAHTAGHYLACKNTIATRLIEPLTVAALNTGMEDASAALLWKVIRACFLGEKSAALPYVVKHSLAEALVDPALKLLSQHEAEVQYQQRLQSIEVKDDTICSLCFTDRRVEIGTTDTVILALPPQALPGILPGVPVPDSYNAIVNGHFLWPDALPDVPLFMGIINGTAQWIFRRDTLISTTTSAANALAEHDSDHIAAMLWKDICTAYGLGDAPLPAHHIIKEKRATFAATPENLAKRPPNATAYRNLFLAGDYTDTGLPATLDSAVLSAHSAAKFCL